MLFFFLAFLLLAPSIHATEKKNERNDRYILPVTILIHNVYPNAPTDVRENFWRLSKSIYEDLWKRTCSISFNTNIRDEDLVTIYNKAPLKRISLLRCNYITDGGLGFLSNFTNLQNLNFDCDATTDKGLLIFSTFTNLESLKLRGCRREGEEKWHHLRNLTNVKVLSLGDSNYPLNSRGIKFLTNLKNLQELDLYNSNIDDATLAYLSYCTSLTTLDLSKCQELMGNGFSHLSNLPLHTINLLNSRKIEAFSFLSSFTNLETINLSCTFITNEDLVYLSSLCNLRYLSLANTRITNGGLIHLSGLPNLWIDLSNTNVTNKELCDRYIDALKNPIVQEWRRRIDNDPFASISDAIKVQMML